MPLDGTVINNIVCELTEKILGGKIDKIYQPERDGIVLHIRNRAENHRLFITAGASHPRVHITTAARQNPETAPQFCMLLRKLLSGGRVTDIIQPDFERIVEIDIESPNEMGDITVKKLIVEIMGKHSNIILTRDGVIVDSIKRVSREKSSVREVLPGLPYRRPPSKGKKNPVNINKEDLFEILSGEDTPQTRIYTSYNGISPVMADEIIYRAGGGLPGGIAAKTRIYEEFSKIMADVCSGNFEPAVYYDEKNRAADFSSVPLLIYRGYTAKRCASVSELLDDFYISKDNSRIKAQKSADLKKFITQNIERCARKREIQIKTMNEIKDRGTLKLYGELLTANIYAIKTGMTSVDLINFYDEASPEITIAVNPLKTPAENAQEYFKRYSKEKRTHLALITQMKQNDDEKVYFEQLLQLTDTCEDEADLSDIRQELYEEGYIKKIRTKKDSRVKKSKPLRFLSSDGFDIYVGKNNKQNEELTLKNASGSDMWLHTKTIPGSHVIIKTNGKEVPDTALNEAAQLACFYSKGRAAQLVPVDYTLKKNVKKPPGSKCGTVTYENFKTAYVTADENIINALRTKD